MTNLRNDVNRAAIAPHEPDDTEKPKMKLFDGIPRQEPVANRTIPENAPSSPATTLTLRLAEARVEDVGHAIARLAPADLLRMGGRAGDVLKITGGAVAVARAELSDQAHEGII